MIRKGTVGDLMTYGRGDGRGRGYGDGSGYGYGYGYGDGEGHVSGDGFGHADDIIESPPAHGAPFCDEDI